MNDNPSTGRLRRTVAPPWANSSATGVEALKEAMQFMAVAWKTKPGVKMVAQGPLALQAHVLALEHSLGSSLQAARLLYTLRVDRAFLRFELAVEDRDDAEWDLRMQLLPGEGNLQGGDVFEVPGSGAGGVPVKLGVTISKLSALSLPSSPVSFRLPGNPPDVHTLRVTCLSVPVLFVNLLWRLCFSKSGDTKRACAIELRVVVLSHVEGVKSGSSLLRSGGGLSLTPSAIQEAIRTRLLDSKHQEALHSSLSPDHNSEAWKELARQTAEFEVNARKLGGGGSQPLSQSRLSAAAEEERVDIEDLGQIYEEVFIWTRRLFHNNGRAVPAKDLVSSRSFLLLEPD
ncbi:hypothetical protein JCM10213_001625 [Rhodosporidiobolus nylandii]